MDIIYKIKDTILRYRCLYKVDLTTGCGFTGRLISMTTKSTCENMLLQQKKEDIYLKFDISQRYSSEYIDIKLGYILNIKPTIENRK